MRYICTGGLVVASTALMILVRRKYPGSWSDWKVALANFAGRVLSCVLLLQDEYPSSDEERAVHIDIADPDVARDLNRWTALVKWLLELPRAVVPAFLWAAVMVCWIIARFAVVLTSRYHRGLFDFVVGVTRWWLRADAYSVLLVTDAYPPFCLEE